MVTELKPGRSAAELTALVGSRICHDLINPLGAIGNGLELLQMSGTANGAEMTLIAESVENANARIRFFRVAYGAASAEQSMGQREIEGIMAGLNAGSRMKVRWEIAGDLPRPDAKLAFLLIQCAETAFATGGEIVVTRDGTGFCIAATGARQRDLGDLWYVLEGNALPRDLGAGEVQFVLAPIELSAHGRRLTLEREAARVTLRF